MADVALSPLRALVEAHRREIRGLVARHKGRAVAIFGSVARGEEMRESDIDFLVDFVDDSSLFDLVRLKRDLVHLLGHDVDVVALGGLLPRDHEIRHDATWL